MNISLHKTQKVDANVLIVFTEAIVQMCSVKKMFLKLSQNSQENTCASVSFLIKWQASSCVYGRRNMLRGKRFQNGKYFFQNQNKNLNREKKMQNFQKNRSGCN